MRTMILVSLLLNIAALLPVCGGILTRADWAREAYGETDAALSILLAVYLAILLASMALAFKPRPGAVGVLLALQVTYKLLTPFTVGSLDHPVVLSNLGIALVHCITLALIWNGRLTKQTLRTMLSTGW